MNDLEEDHRLLLAALTEPGSHQDETPHSEEPHEASPNITPRTQAQTPDTSEPDLQTATVPQAGADDGTELAAHEDARNEPSGRQDDALLLAFEAVSEERDEHLRDLQRLQADFENYRKRVHQERDAQALSAKAAAAETLLPAIDELQRIGSIRAEGHSIAGEDLAAVEKSVAVAIGRLGLTKTGQVGERFNIAEHEAVSTRPAEDGEQSGEVAEVLRHGWRMANHTIRAALVVVTSPPEDRAADAGHEHDGNERDGHPA